MKKFLLLAVLSVIGTMASAQTLFDHPLHSIGLGAGWYSPKLSYINEKLAKQGYEDELRPAFMGQLNAEFNLISNVRLRLEAAHWSQSVNNENIDPTYGEGAFERATVDLTPITANLIVDIPFMGDLITNANLYAGAGVGTCYISEKRQRYSRGYYFNLDTPSGNDTIYHGLLGFEQPLFNSNFNYRVEYDAVFGNYEKSGTQLMNNSISGKKLSLGGQKISLQLAYLFDK